MLQFTILSLKTDWKFIRVNFDDFLFLLKEPYGEVNCLRFMFHFFRNLDFENKTKLYTKTTEFNWFTGIINLH